MPLAYVTKKKSKINNMKYPIKYEDLELSTEFYAEIIQCHKEATEYIKCFDWVSELKSSYLFLNLGSKLCVFLFEIENLESDDDNYLWLIVGDVPPMYLDIYGAQNTIEVLENYVHLSNEWISKAKEGGSLKDCYPFNFSPTIDKIEMFKKRIQFIENIIIPNTDTIEIPKNLKHTN